MLILVTRSGGFAGVSREWRVEPSGDTDEWISLVEACPWGQVADDPASRDRFMWRIEVRLSRHKRAAAVPDRELIGPWRELVDRVKASASEPSHG